LPHLDEQVAATRVRMRSIEGLSEQTIAWTTAVYAVFRRYLVETQSVTVFLAGELDAQLRVLEGWIAWLRDSGRARVTVNNYWRALSLVFTRLQRERGMVNPLLFLETPRFQRHEARYLTRAAAEQVLAYVQHHQWGSRFEASRNLALVGLLLLAGLRRAEALKLQFGDVNSTDGLIHVRGGKGRHGGRDRTCYAAPQLRAILDQYVALRARRGADAAPFLLAVTRDGGIGAGAVRHLFRRISRGVGFPVAPHMMRHTYASLLRASGVSDRIAMELLGHSSLQMLQRYSHVYDGEREAAADELILNIDIPGVARSAHRAESSTR
jgi:integrase